MTTYAGGCSVSVTLTPTPGAVGTFAASASVSVNVSPSPFGAYTPTYEDDQGQLQPVFVREWYKGRTVKQTGLTLTYVRVFHIVGTFETTDCLDLGPQVGAYDDVLPEFIVQNRDLKMYAKGGAGLKYTEMDIVELTVEYEKPVKAQSSGGDAEATYTLEFTSESDHVDVALTQINYMAAGEQPPAGEDKLINFDGKDVNGVEIDAPVTELTEEHTFTEAEFSPAYRVALSDYVKRSNSAVWRGYAIGSVLFDGASATKRQKTWYVSFRFRIRSGLVNKELAIINKSGIANTVRINKEGWEYLWVTMSRAPNGATKLQTCPSGYHVAQVYNYLDFSALGIGTQPLN